MKKDKKLAELTLDELIDKKKKLKGAVIGLGIAMLIACGVLIFNALKNKRYAFIAVAAGSFISLTPSIIELTQIDKEIKRRKS